MATMRRIGSFSLCLLAGVAAMCWQPKSGAAADARDPNGAGTSSKALPPRAMTSWNPKAAAAYLDERAGWWMAWPKSARDHQTFCVSCHTAVPYAMSRPALRGVLGERGLSANESKILENVRKRVRLWKEVAPFYTDGDRGAYKSVESRGTESVLNALILASNDAGGAAGDGAPSGRLSDDTRAAFANMWAEQQTTGERKGAWLWLRFKNEPWEADDSDYYGAALAAIAVGTAPEDYKSRPEIQNNLKMLRDYLNRACAAQTPLNRAVLLWAATKLPGVLDTEQQKAIVDELLQKQQPDGGWSLSSLVGAWQRHDGTAQETTSDGYATGLITFALQQAGMSPENGALKKGLAWLAGEQRETGGFWPSSSLNNNVAHHISPDTVRFMNDAATAYAVLSLQQANAR